MSTRTPSKFILCPAYKFNFLNQFQFPGYQHLSTHPVLQHSVCIISRILGEDGVKQEHDNLPTAEDTPTSVGERARLDDSSDDE